MNDQEIEDKIWENTNEWINKTNCCDKIPTNKKRCFDIIKLMIPTQLKEKTVGNRILIRRIDTTNPAEFDNSLNDQKKWLKLIRDELNRYPKPMFYFKDSIVHYIPPITKKNIKKLNKALKKNRKNPKGFKLMKLSKSGKQENLTLGKQ